MRRVTDVKEAVNHAIRYAISNHAISNPRRICLVMHPTRHDCFLVCSPKPFRVIAQIYYDGTSEFVKTETEKAIEAWNRRTDDENN